MSTDQVDTTSAFLSLKERRDAVWKSLGNTQQKKLLAEVHNLNYQGKIIYLHDLIDKISTPNGEIE